MTYAAIVTKAGQQLFAATGVAPNINAMKVGDANGVAYDPSDEQIALVHEVATCQIVAAPVANSGRVIVEATLAANVGGFTIRELGLYSGATLVMVARVPPRTKPLPVDGASETMTIRVITDFVAGTVTIITDPTAKVGHDRLWQVPYQAVLSRQAAPPAQPATGAAYLILANPTGAWAGQAQKLTYWNGSEWRFGDAAETTLVSVAGEAGAIYERKAAGWSAWAPWVAADVNLEQTFTAALAATRAAIEAEIPAPPNLAPYLLIANQRAATRGVVVENDQYKGVVATSAILGVSRELTTAERVAGALGANPDTANPYLGLEAYAAIKTRLDTIDGNRPTILDYTITAGVSSWLSGDISAYRRVDVVIDNVKASWGGTKTSTAWVNLDFAESPTINAGVVPEICDLRTYYADPSSVTNWVQYGGVAFSLNKGFYSLNGDAGANRWALSGAMWNWGGTAGIAGVLPTVGTKLRLRTINTAASWAATGTLSSGRVRLYCWL